MQGADNHFTSRDAHVAVSIIIVAWNTRDILQTCLRSVVEQTQTRHQIIVVDNASVDGSVDMVEMEFPQVEVIANDANRGFAAACNQGIVRATGTHILLLNPDTVVVDRAIDRMLDWIATRPDVGCCGCQVRESDSIIQNTCFADPGPVSIAFTELGLLSLSRYCPAIGWPEYRGWARDCERDVDVVSGMFMLVPRHVIEQVGLLDEAFFVYSEEADWCRRIRNGGYRCAFTPAARIIHLDGGGKSTSQIRTRMHVQIHKSKKIYARKYYGKTGSALVTLTCIIAAILRLATFAPGALLANVKENRRRVNMSWAALRFHLLGREPLD